LAKSTEEQHRRSAISRAYYAAYCCARAWYEKRYNHQFPRTGPNSHAVVWDAFDSKVSKSVLHAFIAQTGRDLKTRRVCADYDLPFPPQKKVSLEMTIALSDAEAILTTLDAL